MGRKPVQVADYQSYRTGFTAGHVKGVKDGVSAATYAVESSCVSADFQLPTGRRATLQFPEGMTVEEFDFISLIMAPYLAAYRKRLEENERAALDRPSTEAGG